jgi:hypothetical protein
MTGNSNAFKIKLLILSTVAILFSSCEKKIETDNETQSVLDNAVATQNFVSVFPFINEQCLNYSVVKKTNSCTTTSQLTGDTTDANGDKVFDNGPINFIIDFGDGSCASSDGISRSGKIKVTMAKKWSVLSHSITVEFIDYKSNGSNCLGSLKIIRTDSSKYNFEIKPSSFKNDFYQIDFEGTFVLFQTHGENTKSDLSDDIYEITTGNASGVNRQKRTFTSKITTSLIKPSNCKYIVSGILEVTPNGLKSRKVNFGANDCDDEATYTMNDQTITFKLN